jgi:opacity protein-like surface antigen
MPEQTRPYFYTTIATRNVILRTVCLDQDIITANHMSRILPVLASVMLASVTLQAQDGVDEPRAGGDALPVDNSEEQLIEQIKQNHLHWFGGINLQVTNPQGPLQSALNDVGSPGSSLGFDFRGGYLLSSIPVAFAGEIGFSFLGGDNKQRVVQTGLFRDTINLQATSIGIPVTLSARFMPNIGTWVFPYVEGIIGFTAYSATFTYSQRRSEEVRSFSEDRSDCAFNYGVGVGASIKIADYISLPNSLQRTLIDVRMRYLYGSAVEVSNVELIVNEQDPMNSSFDFRTASVSASDNVYFSLGLAFQF